MLPMKTAQMKRVPSLFLTSIMVIAVSVFLFIGLLNSERDLIVLSVLVIGVIILMKVWAKFSSKSIQHSVTIGRNKVFPGETLNIILNVENRKPIPVWMEVELPVSGPRKTFVEPIPITGQQSILWYQKTILQWELKALRRGITTIGPLRFAFGDLLGFFQKESEIAKNLQFIVYPRIVPLGQFKFPRRDFFGIPGGQSPVDDPVYILGTSDYHHGKPAKYIHWKASARYQRLQVKVFDSSEQEKVLFLVDVSTFLEENAEDDFERGIEVIASLAVQCEQRGCALGFLTNGVVMGAPHSVAISRSSRQMAAILETLGRLQFEKRENLLHTLQNSGDIPWGTTCLYLTLNEVPGTRVLRDYMKRRKIPLTILTKESISSLTDVNLMAASGDFTTLTEQLSQREIRPV